MCANQAIQALRKAQIDQALDPTTRPEVIRQAAQRYRGESFSLVIMLDGWMIRERGEQWGHKPPHAPADRVDWREMKSGIVFRIEDQASTHSGRGLIIHKYYEAAREEAHDFGRRMYALALRHGLRQAQRVFVVADGGLWIWNLVEERFASAWQQLDFYHASQHLFAVARALHPQEEQAKHWVTPLLHQLRHGGEAGVINSLDDLSQLIETLQPETAKTVDNTIEYFHTHRDRLHYEQAAALGCPIGSGAMESTCSQFQDRFKRTGQFWTQPGAANLMTLELIRRNREWSEYWGQG